METAQTNGTGGSDPKCGSICSGRAYRCPYLIGLSGAWRFGFVSVVAYSVWAFAGRLFSNFGGDPVMYAAIAIVFLGGTGLCMHGLLGGSNSLRRFYKFFVPAFFAYAFVWSLAWFSLKAGAGEWVGAAVGSLLFVAITRKHLGGKGHFVLVLGLFFLAHTVGYYAGAWSMDALMKVARELERNDPMRSNWIAAAKLSWGLFYGLGFGFGLGVALGKWGGERTANGSCS